MTSFLCTLRSISARLLITDLARRQGALAGPKSATFHETAPLRFLCLLSIFTIISMTITNKVREHKLCSHQKLTRKICTDRDLSTLHQCTIARRFRNLQVEMKLAIQA